MDTASFPTDELTHTVETPHATWVASSVEPAKTKRDYKSSSRAVDPLLGRLATALHTTLDVERMLGIFSAYVMERVPHAGVRFTPHRCDFEIAVGFDGPTRWQESVVVDHELLGQLNVCVEGELSPWESEELRRLGKGLRYPLRNALQHRRALQAAHHDPLTGASNRAALELDMRRDTQAQPSDRAPAAALVLDVDNFKTINDHYGHASGDAVLRAIAERVNACIRAGDRLYRYGGDEFVVLAQSTDSAGAQRLAERIRAAVDDLILPSADPEAPVTISIGVTTVRDSDDSYTLFDRADRALYSAKRGGRNRVVQL